MFKSLSLKPLIGALLAAALSLSGNILPKMLGKTGTKYLSDFHYLTYGAAALSVILVIVSMIVGSRKGKDSDYDENEASDEANHWGTRATSEQLEHFTDQISEDVATLPKAELKEQKKKKREKDKFNKEAERDAAKATKLNKKNSKKNRKGNDSDERGDLVEESYGKDFATFPNDFASDPAGFGTNAPEIKANELFPSLTSFDQKVATLDDFDISAYSGTSTIEDLNEPIDVNAFTTKPEYGAPTFAEEDVADWINEAFSDQTLQYPHAEKDQPTVVILSVEVPVPAQEAVEETPGFGVPNSDETQDNFDIIPKEAVVEEAVAEEAVEEAVAEEAVAEEAVAEDLPENNPDENETFIQKTVALEVASAVEAVAARLEETVKKLVEDAVRSALEDHRGSLEANEDSDEVAEEKTKRKIHTLYSDLGSSYEQAWQEESAGSENPAIKWIDLVLREAIVRGATDIYIEPSETSFEALYNIYDELYLVGTFDMTAFSPIVARVKFMSALDTSIHEVSQSGHTIYRFSNDLQFDLDTATIPTQHGETLVISVVGHSVVEAETLEPQGVVTHDEWDYADTIKVVNLTFEEALNSGATAIRFEPSETTFAILYRIDGNLQRVLTAPVKDLVHIRNYIKIISDMSISSESIASEGHAVYPLSDEKIIEFDTAVVPTPYGELLVVEILGDSDTEDSDLTTVSHSNITELGTLSEQERVERALADTPRLVIVSESQDQLEGENPNVPDWMPQLSAEVAGEQLESPPTPESEVIALLATLEDQLRIQVEKDAEIERLVHENAVITERLRTIQTISANTLGDTSEMASDEVRVAGGAKVVHHEAIHPHNSEDLN